MKQQETIVWKEVLLKYSKLGYKLFRNQRYVGPIVRGGKITKSWANTGLCDGAGDVIGYRIITITAEMIGRKIAQFCSFETKTDTGAVKPEQKHFMSTINNDGGLAEVIRPKDLLSPNQ